jgi:hypothetical protein
MKTIGIAAVLAVVAWATSVMGSGIRDQQISAEEIVARSIEALGGAQRIASWETLRIRYRLPDHNGSALQEIRRPNNWRTSSAVFDGERAARLPRPGSGGSDEVELIPEDEWKDFEMDVAWFVPAFLDHTAEYTGTDSVVGHQVYKLEVSLPLGARMTYYIDATDFVILKVAADATVHERYFHYERLFSNHRNVDGILFPWAFTYPGRQNQVLTGWVEGIEVDVLLPQEHFRIPG